MIVDVVTDVATHMGICFAASGKQLLRLIVILRC